MDNFLWNIRHVWFQKNRNKSIKIGNLFWFLFAISIGSVFLMPQDCYTLNTEEIFFPKWVLLGVYLSHDVEGNFEKFCHTPKIILTENLIRVWELLGNQVTSIILWSNPFISHPTNWKFTLQRSKNSKKNEGGETQTNKPHGNAQK